MQQIKMPVLIKVMVHYTGTIALLTEKECELVQIPDDMPFMMLLNLLFEAYPELMKEYPPGKIGLLLNDHPPTDFEGMHNNDQVYLTTSERFSN